MIKVKNAAKKWCVQSINTVFEAFVFVCQAYLARYDSFTFIVSSVLSCTLILINIQTSCAVRNSGISLAECECKCVNSL